jgi:hypothetical protein
MNNLSHTPYKLFKSFFTVKSLNNIYKDKFQASLTKGIDRLSGVQFGKQAKFQLKVINKKCLKGEYIFSPYLELLQSKGRGKEPRVLAIPTVRDRIVLYALKEILSQIFPECVPRKLANTYIYEIKKFSNNNFACNIGIFRADIKDFYSSIDREKLLSKLKLKIKSHKLIALIQRAIDTPIVPKHYNRRELKKYKEESKIGIPQGLSISNILAAIYLQDFDNEIRKNNNTNVYYRYVDDILIFSNKEKIDQIESLVRREVKSINLKLNEQKTYNKSGEEEFEYLGYRFELPKVTIRASSIEKFIHSITAKFSAYIHNRERKLKDIENKNYGISNVQKLKEIFIDELNEKITGAIKDKQKYGWIFYYNAINDEAIFYKIDSIIANLFKRLEDFNRVPPPNLKKLSRAFYEGKYNPSGGYIHNYNKYETIPQKRKFLQKRGRLDSSKKYSDEEIYDLFKSLEQKNLQELEKDDALLY